MINIIPFQTLGSANHGWLDAHHHFSFARYYDAMRMGFPPLLVWNDDTIQPGTGFEMHPHDNMEIITYVRKGAITHRDSTGNEGKTVAGDVQVMSAGTGILHSEHNEESAETTLFQIWIETAVRNMQPQWASKSFPKRSNDELIPLVSGRKIHAQIDVLPIYQDAAIYAGTIGTGKSFTFELEKGRHLYLVAASGTVTVNGMRAHARDGIHISDENIIDFISEEKAEIVMADLPIL
ncbi:MAG: pirin family protein [Candidatus Marinimicrobia bacterium]|nr:pirin family protein [Candidatus Neomarinimicrobiota bacterium]